MKYAFCWILALGSLAAAQTATPTTGNAPTVPLLEAGATIGVYGMTYTKLRNLPGLLTDGGMGKTRSWTVTRGDNKAVFTPDSFSAMLNGKKVYMSRPIVVLRGEPYIVAADLDKAFTPPPAPVVPTTPATTAAPK
jgi:hypothetical protein